MTRIRYTNVEGVLVSKPLIAGTEVLTVYIDLECKTVDIRDTNNNNVFSGFGATPSKLKAIAKRELKQFGVIFGDEIRRRVDTHNTIVDELTA